MAKEVANPENQTRSQLQVDDSKVVASYANFCRVTGTPEELIVVNFYTAKRLYHALGMTLQRHEAAFGPLEVDVNKRVHRQ